MTTQTDDKARCADWWAGYATGRAGGNWPGGADGRAGFERGTIDAAELLAGGTAARRVKMHDEFTTRAKRERVRLENEQKEKDGRAQAEKEAGLKAVAEAQAAGKPEPLAVVCPQCSSGIGEKCRNYLNARCAPHRERTKLAGELAAKPAPAEATDPRLAKLNELDAEAQAAA